jgi:hypothetical protein
MFVLALDHKKSSTHETPVHMNLTINDAQGLTTKGTFLSHCLAMCQGSDEYVSPSRKPNEHRFVGFLLKSVVLAYSQVTVV